MGEADIAAIDDFRSEDWARRPWVLAGLLAVAGLLVFFAIDGPEEPIHMAITAALIFGSLTAAFTISPDRWRSSAAFAIGVALVMAGIAWRATNAGDRYADEEFWVAAGILCVTLALPLFQAGFHENRLKTSYKATHFHIWTDAITGAGAMAFLGLSWALLRILSELFRAIQIDLLHELTNTGWFSWMFSGAAFGAALGVLRNQLKIIGTLQNVALLVLSILAVPLATALVIFLLAVLVSGLDVLWEATRSATPLLLAIAVGCFVLANAVVRDEDEAASNSRPLRMAGFVLALGILPLAVMASISMGTRIAQHGLSPERLWALVAIAVAVAYGVAYFVSALRGRKAGWRGHLRQSNLHLAVMTSVIALILALPIFNFGAISASNQLARLDSGAVSAEEFDYSALRWDFGDAGRQALAELTESEDADVARLSAAAQMSDNRYGPSLAEREAVVELTDLSALNSEIAEQFETYIAGETYICPNGCVVFEVGEDDEGTIYALLSKGEYPRDPQLVRYDPDQGSLVDLSVVRGRLQTTSPRPITEADDESTIELRPFTGQQIYIDGEPVSAPFE